MKNLAPVACVHNIGVPAIQGSELEGVHCTSVYGGDDRFLVQ